MGLIVGLLFNVIFGLLVWPKDDLNEFRHVLAKGVLVPGVFIQWNFSRLELMLRLSWGDFIVALVVIPGSDSSVLIVGVGLEN